MITDKFGQQIYTESDLINIYLRDPDKKISHMLIDKPINFNDTLDLRETPKLINYVPSDMSIEEFDTRSQDNLFLPESYKSLDIAKFILDQCQNQAELQRAGEELLLFQERDMFELLKYLKYLVDTMRENNIVWGVGRGSSVSSFVLFLIGVHKIHSLYYDLPISEFLK
jgi:DNA polymerase III alpha subunit